MTDIDGTAIGRAFLDESRRQLSDDHLPRIERCVELMSDDELWWRANEANNSAGNLILHLAGNLRQWIVCGIGGEPDRRDRDSEFSERGPLPRSGVLARVRASVTDADATLARADPSTLLELRTVQNLSVTGLYAIYHAVEHFSMHTGQIILLAKLRRGDLGFWDLTDGVPTPTWRRPRSGDSAGA